MDIRYHNEKLYLLQQNDDNTEFRSPSRLDVVGSNFQIECFGKVKYIIFHNQNKLHFGEFYENRDCFQDIDMQVARGVVFIRKS